MIEMKLTCKAQLAIEELCKDKVFANYVDLVSGDDWIRGAAKVASLLSGESEDYFFDLTPGELAEVRDHIHEVIADGYRTYVEAEKDKKKEAEDPSASQESGSSSTDTSST